MTEQMKRAARVAAGRESREASRAWEARVDAALQVAKQKRIVADYVHTEPAFTQSGIPIERSVSDFVGALEGGLGLGIEAKSTKEHRFPAAKISKRQIEYLDALWRAGALSLLAIEFREPTGHRRQFLIPWGEVPWEVAVSARTLTLDALARAGIKPMPSVGTLEHFLWKCNACESYMPARSGRPRHTCCGLMPPF